MYIPVLCPIIIMNEWFKYYFLCRESLGICLDAIWATWGPENSLTQKKRKISCDPLDINFQIVEQRKAQNMYSAPTF